MKLAALALACAVSLHAQMDLPAELEMIRQTEASVTIGARGEQGPWQMTRANVAHYGGCGWREAMALMKDNEAALPRIGMPVNPYTLALAWCLGIPKLDARRISPAAVRYARSVREAYDGEITPCHSASCWDTLRAL